MVMVSHLLFVLAFVLVAGKLLQRTVRYGSAWGKERWAPHCDLTGKLCVITGCNTGIGKETAKIFARWGATIIMACRSKERSQAAMEEIKTATNGHPDRVRFLSLDLSSLVSVRTFVEEIEKQQTRVDILVNNAGVLVEPDRKTHDGFSEMFGVNHLAHYLLTLLFLERGILSREGRVTYVSSSTCGLVSLNFDDLQGVRFGNSFMQQMYSYGNSKLCSCMFVLELDKRLKAAGSKVVVNLVHPGTVQTEIARTSGLKKIGDIVTAPFFKSAEYGAQTTIFAATAQLRGGEYCQNCEVSSVPNKQVYDEDVRKRLWDESARLCNEPRFAEEGFIDTIASKL